MEGKLVATLLNLIETGYPSSYIGKLKKAINKNRYFLSNGGDIIEKITWSPSNLKARVCTLTGPMRDEITILWDDCDIINYPIPVSGAIYTYIEFYDEYGNVQPINDSEVTFTMIPYWNDFNKNHVIMFGVNDIPFYYVCGGLTSSLNEVYEICSWYINQLNIIPIESILNNSYRPHTDESENIEN